MSQTDDQAAEYGRSWIKAHINPGPHSVGDGPVRRTLVDQFVAGAKERGLSEEQLERSLGDIQIFLQDAFDEAHREWKSHDRS